MKVKQRRYQKCKWFRYSKITRHYFVQKLNYFIYVFHMFIGREIRHHVHNLDSISICGRFCSDPVSFCIIPLCNNIGNVSTLSTIIDRAAVGKVVFYVVLICEKLTVRCFFNVDYWPTICHFFSKLNWILSRFWS